MEVESRFGGIRGLKLKNLDLSSVKCKNLLNIGSGKSEFRNICENYFSLDNDPDLDADFKNFADIPDDLKFDFVIANQVFEHISKSDFPDFVSDLSSKMSLGAIIVATVPNTSNWQQFANNYDHKNPLTFYHIGAMFEINNIAVDDCFFYTKRPNEIIDASDTDKYLFDFLKKYFEVTPAQFVAVTGIKKE